MKLPGAAFWRAVRTGGLLLVLIAAAWGAGFFLLPSRMESNWRGLWRSVQAARTGPSFQMVERLELDDEPSMLSQGDFYPSAKQGDFWLDSRAGGEPIQLRVLALNSEYRAMIPGSVWKRIQPGHPFAAFLVTVGDPLGMPQAILRTASRVERLPSDPATGQMRYRVVPEWKYVTPIYDIDVSQSALGEAVFHLDAATGRLAAFTLAGENITGFTDWRKFRYQVTYDVDTQPGPMEIPAAALAAEELN